MTIAFTLTLNCVLGQTVLPNKVSSFINTNGLLPLNEVDKTSKDLPKNFTTNSGWHIDYYARLVQEDGSQLNVYELIYNDKNFHSLWTPNNPKNIKYYPLTFFQETSDFLYLTIHNPEISDTLLTVFKKQDNKWTQSSVQKELQFKNDSLTYDYAFLRYQARTSDNKLDVSFTGGGYVDLIKTLKLDTGMALTQPYFEDNFIFKGFNYLDKKGYEFVSSSSYRHSELIVIREYIFRKKKK